MTKLPFDPKFIKHTYGKTACVTTTLSYDAEKRLYSVGKSGATTKLMCDSTDLIAETKASNGILRRYVHCLETDDPIVWYEGSGTGDKRYYTANRQGSIVGVTLQNGLSTSVNAYDEYGIQKLSTIGRFQYTGQTWIPEVGLYYYKARFYNPNLGRFMQTDPIGYKDGMNWYAYVGNDPINKTDPTGKFAWFAALLFIGAGATASAPANAPAPGDIPQQMSAVDVVAAVIPAVRLERAAVKTGERF